MIGQAERLLELKRLKKDQFKAKSKKIFAFTSGKGGTGKTFLSLNIASVLAQQGNKILYIDLDSNTSNANIMLNVIAAKTIYDFISEKKLLKELITEYSSNLHFIFGDSGKLNYPDIHEGVISKLYNQISTLRNFYDYIFLDTGSGAGKDIINILINADSVIIISSPEPTAVMDSYVMLKLLNAADFKGEKFVIINKSISENDGRSTFNNLDNAASHFLKETLNYLGYVPFDIMASKSIIEQVLLVNKYPESIVTNQVKRICSRFNEFNHMANILQKEISLPQ